LRLPAPWCDSATARSVSGLLAGIRSDALPNAVNRYQADSEISIPRPAAAGIQRVLLRDQPATHDGAIEKPQNRTARPKPSSKIMGGSIASDPNERAAPA